REEGATRLDLARIGAAIAPSGRLAREAARDRGHVDPLAEQLLGDAERLLEPAEERLARGPRERAAELALARAGRLADEQDAARDGAAVHDGADHLRARLARRELGVQDAQLVHHCGG